ncbi:MAG: TIGR02996 domain-containing protein, partial [Gemmataceae bacterium]
MDADHFLAAIAAAPDDDTPRLIYADWLDDHADSARAEFIRIQCQLAQLDDVDPSRDGLEDRELELLRQHERKWFPNWPFAHEWQFRRGFVHQVSAHQSNLPTLGVTATAVEWACMSTQTSFDANPIEHPNVQVLDMQQSGIEIGGPELPYLLDRSWPRLRELRLYGCPGFSDLPYALQPLETRQELKSISVGGRSGSRFAWGDADGN